jgi:hypothetical protein
MIDSEGQYHSVPADARLGPLLTQEEIPSLKDGEIVVITWSGGNGPHSYEIGKCKWTGDVCVVHRLPGIGSEAGQIYRHDNLNFVGRERWHTHVQRLLGP